MVFCSFDPIDVEDLRAKYFWFLPKIRQDRLNFMSLDVIGEYGKILFGVSPYALKYCPFKSRL
jgi:hypothetical protein